MEARAEIAELRAEIEQLKKQNRWLLEQLQFARRQKFGASSEKNGADPGEQMSLFENNTEPSTATGTTEIKAYRRRRAGHIGTDNLPDDIPVEVIEHELAAEDRICSQCGGQLHIMNKEIRNELKLIPARAVILRHVRNVYSCRGCESNGVSVPVVKAAMPQPVIKGSFASPEAVAHIACEKVVMGSPLYRQAQYWQGKGIPLSRQTMSNWLLQSTQDWLLPVYEALKEKLLKQEVLHADETTVQVLREESRSAQSKSYMWLYRTGSDAITPIMLYEYQQTRHGRHPQAFLSEYKGFLHADGYDVYHDLPPEIVVTGCWAHARRRFDEALKTFPTPARASSPPMEAIKQIGELYKIEAELKKLPPGELFDARLKVRQKESKPIVERFSAWCESQPTLGSSYFAKAVNYALNQKTYLARYLSDGRLEIDNNRAERSIKPFVIGRKNWLFCNTPAGAKAYAILYSIIETAKENGLNAFDYLTHIFKNAPNLDLKNNPISVACLLPWGVSM